MLPWFENVMEEKEDSILVEQKKDMFFKVFVKTWVERWKGEGDNNILLHDSGRMSFVEFNDSMESHVGRLEAYLRKRCLLKWEDVQGNVNCMKELISAQSEMQRVRDVALVHFLDGAWDTDKQNNSKPEEHPRKKAKTKATLSKVGKVDGKKGVTSVGMTAKKKGDLIQEDATEKAVQPKSDRMKKMEGWWKLKISEHVVMVSGRKEIVDYSFLLTVESCLNKNLTDGRSRESWRGC